MLLYAIILLHISVVSHKDSIISSNINFVLDLLARQLIKHFKGANLKIKMESFWQKTHDQFSSLIQRPKMNEKLLQKPPLKYIFDIIMQTSKKTNFAAGLLDDLQVNSDYYDNRQKKTAFLYKIITYVQVLSEKKVQANPNKIVAGLEPQKTNELLQQIFKLALDEQKMKVWISGKDVKIQKGNRDKYELSWKSRIIIFDSSKEQIGKPIKNYSRFVRKYKQIYKIGLNKQPLQFYNLKKIHLFIIPGPTQPFTQQQITNLKKLIENGERVMVMANEGGDSKNNTNLNAFTEEYGIRIQESFLKSGNECYKHFYFTEENVLKYQSIKGIMSDKQGVISKHEHANQPKTQSVNVKLHINNSTMTDFFYLIYPNGTSLLVKPPSYPLISCISQNSKHTPIVAVHIANSGGRLMVCGSVNMFNDDHFGHQQNEKFMDFALDFLLTNNINFQLHQFYQKNHNFQGKENSNKETDSYPEEKLKQFKGKINMNYLKNQKNEIKQPVNEFDFYELLSAKGICDITVQILKAEEIDSFQKVKLLKEEDIERLGIEQRLIQRIKQLFP